MDSEQDTATRIIDQHGARNFWSFVIDGSAYYFALSMVSMLTVLPLLVSRLSDERWLQGMIPMIAYSGALLPGLFIAPLIKSLPRRKPFFLLATLAERIPYLLIGLLLVFLPNLPAPLLLTGFFLLYAVQAFSNGFAGTSWQDIVARVIPERRWGTFFGVQRSIGGLIGVAGAALAGYILSMYPFPQSIGVLTLLCFAVLMFGYGFLAIVVEPPQAVLPRQPMGAFLKSIMPLLQRDHTLRHYLLCRSAIAVSFGGHSFLTASALERFNLPDAGISAFTAALLASQAISYLAMGLLADRWGHRQVFELATILGLAALCVAIFAPTAAWFTLVFVLVGAAQAGYMLSGFTVIFSISSAEERPVYIGVANSIMTPVTILGPALGGLLAAVSGYNLLFVVLLAIGMAGLVTFHWRTPAAQPSLAPITGE